MCKEVYYRLEPFRVLACFYLVTIDNIKKGPHPRHYYPFGKKRL